MWPYIYIYTVTKNVVQVKCYSLKGCHRAIKFTLRCKRCTITYNYAQYGNKSGLGYRFYPREREYVEATDVVYYSRKLLEWQCSLA